jgi:hypothetical protein
MTNPFHRADAVEIDANHAASEGPKIPAGMKESSRSDEICLHAAD